MFVLAIDGGGTKTCAVISDEGGHIHAMVTVGKSNPTTMSQKEFEQVIDQVLIILKSQNPTAFAQIASCFAGMAGVKEKQYDLILMNVLHMHLPKEATIEIANDATNALYAGTLGSEGIVQIAGTGAITLGVDEQHHIIRTSGWGFLFDDEGSGYDLGVQALKSVFKAYDGRGYQTNLTARLCQHFQVDVVPRIIDQVYGEGHPRAIISPLSMYVSEEAQKGDIVARIIIQKACEKYFQSIKACLDQMTWSKDKIPVVLAGGVFSNVELFIPILQKLAQKEVVEIQFYPSLMPPIGGAVVGGLKKCRQYIDPRFVEIFNDQLLKSGSEV
ncbi:N-acetylglucosamine kinase [Viridibacillus sp. NPDC093762]|uniref:N-acetylglucosamine kinase n=1 Tax=Viridibacillus sp. NPDC093762 TaxID=3390720 RepID=UPI003CFF34F6